jgi:Zn ribbon nucleic-acid-binding protein
MTQTISEDYPAPNRQAQCPDCGFKHMNIWEHGRVSCGSCLNGGHIKAEKYQHLATTK